MAFSFFSFFFTHKLLVLEQKYFIILSSILYIYVPWTDSISILVTSVHNVSFVLQCIAALFLKCFMYKRTIC